ncbi:MAG: GMC oxidoreductase, partial [Mycobacteriales bacterium]
MLNADYDVVVIGSGFGGSVAALRLTEKGYRVAVVEAGRRFDADTLPRTSWDLRNFLWAPALGCFGIQRISLLRDVVVLSGAGVGGGSLVYANTLYEPLEAFYADPQWAGITDWRGELAPHYERAKLMLGVVENPTLTPADQAMYAVAEDMGVADTFHRTPVGVYFGVAGETVPDPYFGGVGPARTGCIQCGNCMIGCRYGAKNRLDLNYLFLAERAGAAIYPETTVTAVRPVVGGYQVSARGSRSRREQRSFRSEQVIFAAGALGTARLLHRSRASGALPGLSSRLGLLTRTNSEALLGAISRRRDADFSKGVAITSSFHPDATTHVEPVRYGAGSNSMGLLGTVLVEGGPVRRRLSRWVRFAAEHPGDVLRSAWVSHWSERTIIVLVMQTLDNSLTTYLKGRKLSTRPGHGAENPSWIPVGHEVTRRLADKIGGVAGGTWGELFNVPMTAHIIGGAVIGADATTGVIDPYHRVFGHPGLHVFDGAAVPANLGVNPSLTITALAERAASLWPNKGQPDPRPPLGASYSRIEMVVPGAPAVPA